MNKVSLIVLCVAALLAASLACSVAVDGSQLSQYPRLRSGSGLPLLAQARGPLRYQVGPRDRAPRPDLEPDVSPPPEQAPSPPSPPTQPPKASPPHTTLSFPSTYSPWVFGDSDRRYLSDDDVAHLPKDQLWKARNEIFARRGYRFHTDRGIAYGRSLGGYYTADEPDGTRVYNRMNDYERRNIELIKRYER